MKTKTIRYYMDVWPQWWDSGCAPFLNNKPYSTEPSPGTVRHYIDVEIPMYEEGIPLEHGKLTDLKGEG